MRILQIVRALEGDVSLDDLNEGMKKNNSAMFGSGESSDYDGGSYDLKKFKKSRISSQEFTSGEHGTTGEFVHSSGESHELGQIKRRP